MSSILDTIVAHKREEVAHAQAARPAERLQAQLSHAPAVRDFFAALSTPGPIRLIAEVKKASPSAGVLRDPFRPAEIARTYAQHGAAAISVLTDERFFQGRLDDLTEVRLQSPVPVLRKDFVIDAYQILEARVAGADAVLLIAEVLAPVLLVELLRYTHDLGMAALVELYEPDNLPWVVESGARIIGINNRNLRTFETDLEHTLSLRGRIPGDRILVAESGIRTREDVVRLQSAGVQAMLVGETLMRRSDVGAAVDELLRGGSA